MALVAPRESIVGRMEISGTVFVVGKCHWQQSIQKQDLIFEVQF
jgi:hypothetical protein